MTGGPGAAGVNATTSPSPAAALNNMVAQAAAQASQSPYIPYGYKTPQFYPAGHFTFGSKGTDTNVPMLDMTDNAYTLHWKEFNQKWNNDPKWRTTIITLAQVAGINGINSKSWNFDAQQLWDYLGKQSSDRAKFGIANQTPMEVLFDMAGVRGDGSNLANIIKGGIKSLAGSHTSTSTDTTYDISDPETAKALTNLVLTSALGRKATDAELAQYKAALNAAERANPTVHTGTTTTSTDALGNTIGSNTTGTTTGGMSQDGKKQVIDDKASATPEGQAYQTNDVFNKALSVLAGL